MNVNYTLPFNKVPVLNWVTGTARYGSNYRWEASPRSIQSILANTIENSNTIQLNGGVRMVTLYNKVGFLRKLNQALTKTEGPNRPGSPGMKKEAPKVVDKKKQVAGKTNANSDTTDVKPKKDYLRIIGNNLAGVFMAFKDGSINYSETNGTLLPGFKPESGVLGNNWQVNAPGLGFIFGSQDDIRYKAVANGWLSKDTLLNTAYLTRQTKNLTVKANLEPLHNLKIELSADRTESFSHQEYFKANANGDFNTTGVTERGSFSMSYIIWKTAFVKDNGDNINPTFEKMKAYRIVIANRLAANNPNSTGIVDSTQFPVGYGPTSPDVLLPAFLAAYSGRSPESQSLNAFPKIPIPNWRITYNGLSQIKSLKSYFSSININHAYRSTYSIGSYASNTGYGDGDYPSVLDQSGNFITKNLIDVVSISEQFVPFIGIDVTMVNSMLLKLEYKKARNLSLSFANNQLTEISSSEFVFGLGYRFKDVKMSVSSMGTGGKKQQLKSDLTLKMDFGLRDNKTVLRRLDEAINQISTGYRQISIKTTADYVINQKLNIRFFFDKTITNPFVSNQFYTSQTNGGITLRFTLSQ